MSIAATIWLILQWLIIISVIFAILALVIALFHPLRFHLNLRGSVKGQRAELWFFYLFRLLKIGVIATPHTQDVVLKIWFWEKILQRNQRPRKPSAPSGDGGEGDFPAGPADATRPDAEAAASTTKATTKSSLAAKDESTQAKTDIKKSAPASDAPKDVADASTATADQDKASPPSNIEAPAEETETDSQVEPEEEVHIPEASEPEENSSEKAVQEPRAEENPCPERVESESLAPISDIDPFSKEQGSQTKQEQKSSQPGFRQKMRNIKQLISKKYQQGKKWLRFAGRKYKLLKPIFLKFWRRARKAFRLENPAIMCRYALHEPFLTGMFQGNMAIVSGVLQGFGVNFVPVPVFGAPTIYAKAKASAVIRPWRMVLAVIALFFEITLWKECYKLFIWYKNSKTT
jgi:hypothetical protein